MTQPWIDYGAVFQASPSAMLVLSPDFIILDANASYQELVSRSRGQLIGQAVFDAYPDNPNDPQGGGLRELRDSLQRVLETRTQDIVSPHRHDVEDTQRSGVFMERYWSLINAPVVDINGDVRLILHRLEEITGLVHPHGQSTAAHQRRQMEIELYARSRELQQVNERLRLANARERQVALALQEAMLPVPQPLSHHKAAVRYYPAVDTLNVCGDWYDVIELPNSTYAVAVGDVVGHGLEAAGVMGQLRSALTAVMRVADGPASALDGLDLYTRSLKGALSTTAVQTVIAWREHRITYSSAGHPPPALVHPNGFVQFLDQATDPPLGASPEHTPRPQATITYEEGAILVLYTDGLIERRGEDIDQGIQRLSDHLTLHHHNQAEDLAQELSVLSISTDDTAVVVLRL
ncbi:PP2C family protein-serine/threonine phosphatase [Streptomyces sp. NPDC056161]|uniref:PP2C family protein-serine/threonine phosphatase n=1 Tax=Streptomyces sp. NPDC056161 TaxID=3345732 RepID=UPI0035E12F3B